MYVHQKDNTNKATDYSLARSKASFYWYLHNQRRDYSCKNDSFILTAEVSAEWIAFAHQPNQLPPKDKQKNTRFIHIIWMLVPSKQKLKI